MTPKKWLEKEGFLETVGNLDCETNNGFGYPVSILMERYANYKTKELDNKILDFRVKMPLYSFLTIRDKYDENFNIETSRNEKDI